MTGSIESSTDDVGTAVAIAGDGLALCLEADVPYGEGRSIALAHGRIGIFNTAAGFFAIDNTCPHEGGPLSDGILADTCVTCPLHGWRIDLETGQVRGRDERVRSYPLEVRDGTVWMMPDAGSEPMR